VDFDAAAMGAERMSHGSAGWSAGGRDQQFVTEITQEVLVDARLREIHAYWLSRRQGDAPPPLAAIDPLAMPRGVLPWISVMDVEHAPLRFRSRLVGTEVVEAIGIDHSGRYLDTLPSMEGQLVRFTWCAETRHPYLARATMTWSPRDYKGYRTLALPFVDAEGRVARIVHAFVFE